MTMTPTSTISDFAMFAEVEAMATEQIAVHHHLPPVPGNLLVPAKVCVHVVPLRNQFSTFHVQDGAILNSCPFRRSRPQCRHAQSYEKTARARLRESDGFREKGKITDHLNFDPPEKFTFEFKNSRY